MGKWKEIIEWSVVFLFTGIVCGLVWLCDDYVSEGLRDSQCPDGKNHVFGPWRDDWEKPSDLGYMRQSSYCTNCHQIRIGLHH